MQVKILGIKEFRQNMSSIADQVAAKKYRFVIARKNKPVFELRPLTEKDLFLEDVRKRIENAKNSKSYTTEEVIKLLNL